MLPSLQAQSQRGLGFFRELLQVAECFDRRLDLVRPWFRKLSTIRFFARDLRVCKDCLYQSALITACHYRHQSGHKRLSAIQNRIRHPCSKHSWRHRIHTKLHLVPGTLPTHPSRDSPSSLRGNTPNLIAALLREPEVG